MNAMKYIELLLLSIIFLTIQFKPYILLSHQWFILKNDDHHTNTKLVALQACLNQAGWDPEKINPKACNSMRKTIPNGFTSTMLFISYRNIYIYQYMKTEHVDSTIVTVQWLSRVGWGWQKLSLTIISPHQPRSCPHFLLA